MSKSPHPGGSVPSVSGGGVAVLPSGSVLGEYPCSGLLVAGLGGGGGPQASSFVPDAVACIDKGGGSVWLVSSGDGAWYESAGQWLLIGEQGP